MNDFLLCMLRSSWFAKFSIDFPFVRYNRSSFLFFASRTVLIRFSSSHVSCGDDGAEIKGSTALIFEYFKIHAIVLLGLTCAYFTNLSKNLKSKEL